MRLALFLGTLLSLVPASAVFAQGGKKEEVAVRYVAQVVPRNLGTLVMAAPEDRVSDPFELSQNNLSEPLMAPARAFSLRTTEKSIELAKIALPEGGRNFIVLLVPAKEGGFEPVIIPDDGQKFKPGDFYLHNVSGKPIMSRVGTTEVVVPNRSGKVVRPKGAREGRFYDVLIGVKEQTGARVISSSRWPLQEQMRTYVFFFNNPKRGDVDFRAVDEFVPPKDDE